VEHNSEQLELLSQAISFSAGGGYLMPACKYIRVCYENIELEVFCQVKQEDVIQLHPKSVKLLPPSVVRKNFILVQTNDVFLL